MSPDDLLGTESTEPHGQHPATDGPEEDHSGPARESTVDRDANPETEISLRRHHAPSHEDLTRRLTEQVAANAALDADLRYLMKELAVQKEFIADLELRLASAVATTHEQHNADSRLTAQRRFSRRAVRGIARHMHRLPPWLYRPLRRLVDPVLSLNTDAPKSGDSR